MREIQVETEKLFSWIMGAEELSFPAFEFSCIYHYRHLGELAYDFRPQSRALADLFLLLPAFAKTQRHKGLVLLKGLPSEFRNFDARGISHIAEPYYARI